MMKGKLVSKLVFIFVVVGILSACASPVAPLNQPPTPVQTEIVLPTDAPTPAPIKTDPLPPTQAVEVTPTGEVSGTEEPAAPDPEILANFTAWVAYIGPDGNLWLVGGVPTQQMRVTTDASGYPSDGSNAQVVQYTHPKWSSDGALLAFERQEGTPDETGYTFAYSLWIYDTATGKAEPVLSDQITTGVDWWPGKHVLAFGQALDMSYFGRTGPDQTYARGIRLFDVDSREVSDLVAPARGYHLADPKFSPDGRFLSFREITQNEGFGNLGLYDISKQEYLPLDEPIGSMAWNADSQSFYYDDLTYVAQGNEAIYIQDWSGGEANLFSKPVEGGFAYMPAVYDDGNLVAYLVNRSGPDSSVATLVIADLRTGEYREFDKPFEAVSSMSWSAGWPHVLIVGGSWSAPVIYLVNAFKGSREILAEGSQASWNPSVKLQ